MSWKVLLLLCMIVCAGRHHVREVHQDETSQVELFLNSVPILASLTREEKMMLVDALEEQAYAPASRVINQVCTACTRHSCVLFSLLPICLSFLRSVVCGFPLLSFPSSHML